MALRLRRKDVAAEPVAPAPAVQPYDDGPLRKEIADLKAKLCAALEENVGLVKKLIEMESEPEEKKEWGFDVSHDASGNVVRVVARETSVNGSPAPSKSTTSILYG